MSSSESVVGPAVAAPALLEVIVNSVADAVAAVEGGASRLEVSGRPGTETSPAPELVATLRAETTLPVRVFLTVPPGFVADADFVARMEREIPELREAGADAFVFGYLTAEEEVDTDAVQAIRELVTGCAWTFHRAYDHARDPAAAWRRVGEFDCDTLLTGGHPDGVSAGWSTLLETLAWSAEGGPRVLVGGGLRIEHIAPLAAAGARRFHIGTGAREVPRGPVVAKYVSAYRKAADIAVGS